MFVKICGVTDKETAKVVENANANFIGFVFAPSKREISTEDAKAIAQSLQSNIQKVGVFVNETKERICYVAEEVGLDYIQLHGDESADFANSLPYPVIKAFSIDTVTEEDLYSYPAKYLLIDSPPKQYRGGSGTSFDWSKLATYNIPKERFILAGGLSMYNIEAAKKEVQPFAVDVSSGVETNGTKDHDKIKQFIALAKKDDNNDNI